MKKVMYWYYERFGRAHADEKISTNTNIFQLKLYGKTSRQDLNLGKLDIIINNGFDIKQDVNNYATPLNHVTNAFYKI